MRLLPSHMTRPTRYVMLMCSLPYHGRLFAATQTPLSRLHLDKRLRMLAAEDHALLDRIERVVQWDAIGDWEADAALVRDARGLLRDLREADLTTLHDALQDRLEIRTIVAALRRRHEGGGPPGPDDDWGLSRWQHRLAENWDLSDFGVSRKIDWLPEAKAHLDAGEPVALERLLLSRVWRDLGRFAQNHEFDFTAVVLYVMRWHLIDRWTRMDGDAAQRRFDNLVSAGLGDYARLFPDPSMMAGEV